MGGSSYIRDLMFNDEFVGFYFNSIEIAQTQFFNHNDKKWKIPLENLLIFFCLGITIEPVFSPNDFCVLLPIVIRALTNQSHTFSKIEDYLLCFLQHYVEKQSEEILIEQSELLTPVLEVLTVFLTYYDKQKMKRAISIVQNLTALKNEKYIEKLAKTDFIAQFETQFHENGINLENMDLLGVVFNVFFGNSALKNSILSSEIIMDNIVDYLESEVVFEMHCMGCLKILFKGSFNMNVAQFFIRKNELFELLYFKCNELQSRDLMNVTVFMLDNLISLNDMIVRGELEGTPIINFSELKNEEGFYQAYSKIKESFCDEYASSYCRVIEYCEKNMFN